MKITKKFLEVASDPYAVKSITREKNYVIRVRNNGETSVIPRDVYDVSVSRAMVQLGRDLALLINN